MDGHGLAGKFGQGMGLSLMEQVESHQRRIECNLLGSLTERRISMRELTINEVEMVSGASAEGAAIGGFVGGVAGGVAGSRVGASIGAALGSPFGPVGMIGGSMAGAYLGGRFGPGLGGALGGYIGSVSF